MSKTLVVVESPAKARTISRFLGNDVQVQASMGHVRDLPEHSIGVDLDHGFQPEYELTANGKKIIKGLKQAASGADAIYLATDPDREGEAIAWHLQEVLKHGYKGKFYRITFHEITQSAIERSFSEPGSIKDDLVAAQQARRVLDRIVGYQVSPLLWRSIKKGTSAGRVQSVALRLVVEREREIQAFVPEEYWNMDALFGMGGGSELRTRLFRLNGEKAVIHSESSAKLLSDALQSEGVVHRVSKVTSTPRRQSAPPPFITSTLQQACGSALKLGASQTMRIAQELYEGIELGSGGAVGLITYMRTDSVNIAKEAQDMARAYIGKVFGAEYVPEKPNVYRSRKSAQEAHEAIRPTDVNRTPDSLAGFLSPQQLKVYRIIWNRFLASQMAAARQFDHVIEIDSNGGALATTVLPSDTKEQDADAALNPAMLPAVGVVCTFRASARETVFPGYLKVYNIKDIGDEDTAEEMSRPLPKVTEGTLCTLLKLLTEQCFTTPPGRYSEASLVKALELNGVGRPSTFATTVNTIQERDYVTKDKGSLQPTQLGFQVNDFLVQQMPKVFDIGFTSQMEEELDQVEEGTRNWIEMLQTFYEKFKAWQLEHDSEAFQVSDDTLQAILDAFPADFVYDPPVQKGTRKYDDAKFHKSVNDQLAKGKDLTVRQKSALMNMVARYWDRVPALASAVGTGEVYEKVAQAREKLAEEAAKPPVVIPPPLLALFDRMSSIEWEAPVKRGVRTYDDGKFVKSLSKQVQGGKELSESQMTALLKVAGKYAAKIEGYSELVVELSALAGIAPAEGASSEASATSAAPAVALPVAMSEEAVGKLRQLLAMVDEIKEWRPPTGRAGRRAFDDHEFALSLQHQFEQKGSLSDRQIAALKKMLTKYSSQIQDYEARANAAGIGEAAAPSQQLDECCPDCGAPLVQRMGRGRPFIGCSAFPKCRYIKPREK